MNELVNWCLQNKYDLRDFADDHDADFPGLEKSVSKFIRISRKWKDLVEKDGASKKVLLQGTLHSEFRSPSGEFHK